MADKALLSGSVEGALGDGLGADAVASDTEFEGLRAGEADLP